VTKRALAIAAFAAFVTAGSARADESAKTPSILIIHSYNREYGWTEDMNRGIMECLDMMAARHVVYTEYLDWKRFPDDALVERVRDVLAHKFLGRGIDIVVTTDDRALQFAVAERPTLFPEAAIVFSGVYPEALPSLTKGARNITGVFENQDPESTLRIAQRIRPTANAVYIVSNLNESGIAVERHIREVAQRVFPGGSIVSLSDLTIEGIERKVAELDADSVLIVGTYSIEKSGRFFSGETLIARLASASRVPVYVMNTHQLGTGAIGGNLLDPHRMGRAAGDLAVKILDGAKADTIKPLIGRSHTPMFDYHAMRRHRIEAQRLPFNATIINQEPNLVVKWRGAIVASAVLFLLMLLLIDTLYTSLRKEKSMSRDLAAKNDEIGSLNEDLRSKNALLEFTTRNLETSEERFRLAALGSNDAIWDWDIAADRVHYSDRWFEMTGYERDNRKPRLLTELLHPDDRAEMKAVFEGHVDRRTDHFEAEARVKTADGSYKWVLVRGKAVWGADGRPSRFAGSITDIDERKRREAEIENLAFYDQLTGLPNRTLAIDITRHALSSIAQGKQCGIIFIDIDNFKVINDTFGHAAGDAALVSAATVMRTIGDERVKVARFGGDEFIIIVSDSSAEEIEKYAKLILRLLGRRTEINGRYHYLTVSAGVSIYPDHDYHFEGLLQKADAALHFAKADGKNRYRLYDSSMQERLSRRVGLEADLRAAFDRDELSVAYQAQVDPNTGRVRGAEALARWNSLGRGQVSPAEFIPIAEETGLIFKLGAFVLRDACRFIAEEERKGNADFTVSVNVSVKQVEERDFADRVSQILREEGVNPSRISLEITESFLIESLEAIVERLRELKKAGFGIALDDFGKGYSSLSYLRALPINHIKIDKAFIDDLAGSDGILVRTIVEVSHQLGLTVVAEGVESKEQVDALRSMNCDLIQGYYYQRPVAQAEMSALFGVTFN